MTAAVGGKKRGGYVDGCQRLGLGEHVMAGDDWIVTTTFSGVRKRLIDDLV